MKFIKYWYLFVVCLIFIIILISYELRLFHQGIFSLIFYYRPSWVPKELLIYSVISLLLLMLCFRSNLSYNFFRLIILVLIILSFYSFYHCGKPIKKEIDFGNKTYSEFFQNKRDIDRVIILNSAGPFFQSFSSILAMRYKTPALGGMFFETIRYAKFIRLFNENFSDFNGEQKNNQIFSYPLETSDVINEDNIHLVNLVNIKYLVAKGIVPQITTLRENSINPFRPIVDKDIKIYENKDALSRAYIVHNMKVIKDEKLILEELKNPQFNYRDYVILEEEKQQGDELEKPREINDIDYFNGQILPKDEYAKITEYNVNNLTVEANMLKDGFLVLSEAYYPGWKVFIDGIQGHIYIANYLFRGVFLKKGLHKVQFIYEPFSVRIGAIISIISLIVLITMFIILLLNRQKEKLRSVS